MERCVFRIRRKSQREKWEKLLVRGGVKLYGTRWCPMCSKQKAVLSNVCFSWERFYVDCDVLRNVLECSTVTKIPSWRVAGKWYIGAQSESSLKQLVEFTEQGMQRWDVAEFSRRHRRRGKWAKEEFANVVKRSVLKARATNTAAASHPPLPVVHCSMAGHVPESGEGFKDTRNFMAHPLARDLIIVALAAANITQEKFNKVLQVVTSNSALSFKSQIRSLSKFSTRMESFEKVYRKLLDNATELETSKLITCKDEYTRGQDHDACWSNSDRRLSGFGRQPTPQHLLEKVATEVGACVVYPNVLVRNQDSHLHEILPLSEDRGMKLRRSLLTVLERLRRGLQNLNVIGMRVKGAMQSLERGRKH